MALLFPIWGVAAPLTLVLFIFILLRLPANIPIPYALLLSVLMLLGIGLCATIAIICDDDTLRVNKDGIRFPVKFLSGLKGRNQRTWEELRSLRLNWKRNKNFSADEHLDFIFQDGGAVRLRLQQLNLTELEQFFIAFEACGYKCERDADLSDFELVVQSRNQENQISYTELWEKSLANKFCGTNFVPLEANNRLQSGRYEILKQLAFGGFAAVYLARPESGGFVVIKESNLQDSDEAQKKAGELFAREASILRSLTHPNIARVRDYFIENGRHYIVMQHIEGIDLGRLVLKEGPQSAQTVIEWMLQVASTLKYMHDQTPPVVHRDLTADNLVLKPDGTLVIIDFGAANEIVGNFTRTIVGKQAFMAPEQFKGKASPKSDVYSLGASAYFLLSGKEPEPLSTSRPSLIVSTLPKELDDLIAKCTSIDESSRPDCALLIEHLTGFRTEKQDALLQESRS